MSFFDKLFGLFRKGGNESTSPSRTDDVAEADTWQPIPRDYSQIDASHKPVTPPATNPSTPGHVLPTIPSGAQVSPDVTPLRASLKTATVATGDVQATHVASSTKAAQPKSTRCPHGKRRREFCPICDPDGYAYNFGDWTRD